MTQDELKKAGRMGGFQYVQPGTVWALVQAQRPHFIDALGTMKKGQIEGAITQLRRLD